MLNRNESVRFLVMNYTPPLPPFFPPAWLSWGQSLCLHDRAFIKAKFTIRSDGKKDKESHIWERHMREQVFTFPGHHLHALFVFLMCHLKASALCAAVLRSHGWRSEFAGMSVHVQFPGNLNMSMIFSELHWTFTMQDIYLTGSIISVQEFYRIPLYL